MASQIEPGIDEYLRKRLMPVEGSIPHLARTDMYGDSIPAGVVGGDLFEYINFQQRYDIDARIARALRLSTEYLEPLSEGHIPRNSVDQFAENLRELYTTAGVLLVDAQGHGVISAKIASTVHDTFHAFILAELDRYGRTTPKLFENINLRLAQSVTARNALGRDAHDRSREIATMIYGEIRPEGHFRFVNFGSPPPLVFSAEFGCFVPMCTDYLAQFPALGLEIPEDHPDRNKYFSMALRQRLINASNISEITLMSPGDIVFLYSDGVYDGSDDDDRAQLERIVRDHKHLGAKEICNAILDYAVERDQPLHNTGQEDRIDDKTAFIIKHG